MLAEVLEDQVALSHRASGNNLDRIDTTGIVFNNCDKIFIFGTADKKVL
jgi:hypothetical protein